MEIEKYKAVAYREFLWDSEDEDEGVEVVLASDHDAAMAEKDAEAQAAEAALKEMRAKCGTLKTGLDATEASEGMLEWENERLKAENAALRTRNERLVAWAKTLSENCTTFQERNRALRTENAANKALIEAWKPSHQIAQIVIAPDADDLEALRVDGCLSIPFVKIVLAAIASRAATKGESEA